VEKTFTVVGLGADRKKHLHMRGENPYERVAVLHAVETPPHAWRKHILANPEGTTGRNTSTCVEKTVNNLIREGNHKETPPHAWRKPHRVRDLPLIARNTSTCVEKTQDVTSDSNAIEKHLHMRGENIGMTIFFAWGRETPPHAWRKLPYICEATTTRRNTSTCVEKTYNVLIASIDTRKHLHMRGENRQGAKDEGRN